MARSLRIKSNRAKKDPSPQAVTISIQELAIHVESVSEQLAALTHRAQWPQLTMLFQMARIEARRGLAQAPAKEPASESGRS